MLDEAIRRNITELVASAFGGHTPGSDTKGISSSGMEVQEVTVYVNNRPNPISLNGDAQSTLGNSGIPSNVLQNNSPSSSEGSISIQNVPFLPPRIAPSSSTNNEKEDGNTSAENKFSKTPSSSVSIIQLLLPVLYDYTYFNSPITT